MNEMRYFLGREGFIWFLGVVEDRNDPEQLGRVRVRCFGWHTDEKSLIPTDALPWAQSVHPSNVPASYAPKEGDWVVGFFADGNSAQHPMILGTLPGKPADKPDSSKGFSDPNGIYPKRTNESSLSRLARGRTDGTIIEKRSQSRVTGISNNGGKSWDEPSPAYGTQYPLNFALESESGHALELDDTPGKERVHLAHNNGSYIEWDASGNRVEKIVRDKYTITMGNDHVFVKGSCSLTVEGDLNISVGGTYRVQAGNIELVTSNSLKALAAGKGIALEGSSFDVSAGRIAMTGSESMDLTGGSGVTIMGATVDVVAAAVDLQAASSAKSASGSGLNVVPMSAAVVVDAMEEQNSVSGASAASKGITGVSSTVSGVYTGAMAQINSGLVSIDVAKNPVDLSRELTAVQNNLNGMSGDIVSLPPDQLELVRENAAALSYKASVAGSPITLDKSILPQVGVSTRRGKRLYPITETI